MKCTECKIDYPDGCVNELMTLEGYRAVCGICALTLTNKLHNVRRAMFSPGSQAERVRRACVAFREKLALKK